MWFRSRPSRKKTEPSARVDAIALVEVIRLPDQAQETASGIKKPSRLSGARRKSELYSLATSPAVACQAFFFPALA